MGEPNLVRIRVSLVDKNAPDGCDVADFGGFFGTGEYAGVHGLRACCLIDGSGNGDCSRSRGTPGEVECGLQTASLMGNNRGCFENS